MSKMFTFFMMAVEYFLKCFVHKDLVVTKTYQYLKCSPIVIKNNVLRKIRNKKLHSFLSPFYGLGLILIKNVDQLLFSLVKIN